MIRSKASIFQIAVMASLLFLSGCGSYQRFYQDNGRNWRTNKYDSRFTQVKEQDFIIDVNKYENEIHLDIFTKFNAPKLIKERGVTIQFEKKTFSLVNGTELTKHERESVVGWTDSTFTHRAMIEYYTCDNLNEELKKSNRIILELDYELDSSGITKKITKRYDLHLKTRYYFSVH